MLFPWSKSPNFQLQGQSSLKTLMLVAYPLPTRGPIYGKAWEWTVYSVVWLWRASTIINRTSFRAFLLYWNHANPRLWDAAATYSQRCISEKEFGKFSTQCLADAQPPGSHDNYAASAETFTISSNERTSTWSFLSGLAACWDTIFSRKFLKTYQKTATKMCNNSAQCAS